MPISIYNITCNGVTCNPTIITNFLENLNSRSSPAQRKPTDSGRNDLLKMWSGRLMVAKIFPILAGKKS